MEFTKHTHATVVFGNDGHTIAVDAGAYTPNSAELVAQADAVLITHDHPDHFDQGILTEALAAQPELRVWGPASVVETLGGDGSHDGRVSVAKAGDRFEVAGLEVEVFGENHAAIHPDLPLAQNVGFLVGGVFHPGDAYLVPGVPVETLLVPTSGPWTKTGEAVDYIRAVKPTATIQIHDLMLSDAGRGSSEMFLGENGMTGIPMRTLALGETITL
jgi:L-ascorbate metabolism protein UlaG (beta-lactamase superfamily)